MQQMRDVQTVQDPSTTAPVAGAQMPAIIGAAQAAKRLGCDVTTVQRWARSGKLPVALKMPGTTGALVFARADVEALAETLAKADAA